jgi:hypothetical protein
MGSMVGGVQSGDAPLAVTHLRARRSHKERAEVAKDAMIEPSDKPRFRLRIH